VQFVNCTLLHFQLRPNKDGYPVGEGTEPLDNINPTQKMGIDLELSWTDRESTA